MNRVVSGVQPTGNLTLGNYLGAIRNWVDLQQNNECLFFIVDLHALTVPQNPTELSNQCRLVAAAYIACGIDPKKSKIFMQSHVPGHSELAWLLNCATPLGWLNRMTQFKDKAGKNKDKANLGLYSYPVLMAADILLYGANQVPVGDDQKQHLELTRDIAISFNQRLGETFVVPDPMIVGSAARVMSLRDGTVKMSKSDPSDLSRINLTDDDDTIVKKIKKAKSDSLPLPENDTGLEDRPEVRNLLNIYSALESVDLNDACGQFAGKNFSDLKETLAESLVTSLSPIRSEMLRLMNEPKYLDEILIDGAVRANEYSNQTMKRVRNKLGLLSF